MVGFGESGVFSPSHYLFCLQDKEGDVLAFIFLVLKEESLGFDAPLKGEPLSTFFKSEGRLIGGKGTLPSTRAQGFDELRFFEF